MSPNPARHGPFLGDTERKEHSELWSDAQATETQPGLGGGDRIRRRHRRELRKRRSTLFGPSPPPHTLRMSASGACGDCALGAPHSGRSNNSSPEERGLCRDPPAHTDARKSERTPFHRSHWRWSSRRLGRARRHRPASSEVRSAILGPGRRALPAPIFGRASEFLPAADIGAPSALRGCPPGAHCSRNRSRTHAADPLHGRLGCRPQSTCSSAPQSPPRNWIRQATRTNTRPSLEHPPK